MPADFVESLFAPNTILWLVGSAMAAAILFGSLNRRRNRLTDSLREYVDENQPAAKKPTSDPERSDPN
ncbi:hypothetical protein [Rubripirellula lacrimiformis]|uniref:hypothetical protein n=1 Tax=Rubripirellula lacrimiformis TaxID=1930273 RepID=UPI0011A1F42E|nr:hypothetical protein [Rubripirellula lacrimiformis]